MVSILIVKDKSIINEIPASRPRIKRMAVFCMTIEKGIKNIFPSISSFIVLKTLDFIEYLLICMYYIEFYLTTISYFKLNFNV
jgi:hypothetical protein